VLGSWRVKDVSNNYILISRIGIRRNGAEPLCFMQHGQASFYAWQK